MVTETPVIDVEVDLETGSLSFSEAIEQAAQQGAAAALRSMREDAKLSRQDAGKASELVAAMVKTHRQRNRLTQVELSRLARVHPTTVGKIEACERGMSLVTFCRMAEAFAQRGDKTFAWDIIGEVNTWA